MCFPFLPAISFSSTLKSPGPIPRCKLTAAPRFALKKKKKKKTNYPGDSRWCVMITLPDRFIGEELNFWQEHFTHVTEEALAEAQPRVRCSVSQVAEVKQVAGTGRHRHWEEVVYAYIYILYIYMTHRGSHVHTHSATS